MKKVVILTESDLTRMVNRVINEQYAELEKIFITPLIKGLEKTDSKAFNELSTILGRGTDETLSGAFDRVLSRAVDSHSRQDAINIMKFCRELSSVNDKFAEEFYQSQKGVIDRIRKQDPERWELLVKGNYGKEVLEKYKKNNIKPVEQKPTSPKPPVQVKPETGIPKGNFPVRALNNNSKFDRWIDQFYQKVFYEGKDKRFDSFSMDIIKQFTPETKSYLLQLLDIVKQKKLTHGLEMGFKNDFNRLPKTVDEEIQMLSCNFWGGYGRRGGLQGILDEPPYPSDSVRENLMNVTMTPKQSEELTERLIRIVNSQ